MHPKNAPEAAPGRSEIFASSRERWLLAICTLELVLLIALSVTWSRSHPPTTPPRRATYYSPTNREPFFLGQPGPWGDLEYARINIEPLDDYLPAGTLKFEPTQWFFPHHTPDQVAALLTESGLAGTPAAGLLNRTMWQVDSNGITLTPSTKEILELSPAARERIYPVLARTERNQFQFWPYTFRRDGFDDWFSHAKLSPNTLTWLKRLMYPRGTAICFSDLPELLTQVPDGAERRRLVKALLRNATLLMKLRVRPDSDIPALTAYWGAGRRAKDLSPLLESLTKVEGSITVDVAHLLPAFARKRLYTYPQPEPAQGDCFWTAMNFFNDPPDERYRDENIWARELQEKFELVNVNKPTLGDVIFLLRPDDVPVHAAVYVADGAVFTKNGGHNSQPWVLMKLEDMLARYPESYPVRLAVYHRKAGNP